MDVEYQAIAPSRRQQRDGCCQPCQGNPASESVSQLTNVKSPVSRKETRQYTFASQLEGRARGNRAPRASKPDIPPDTGYGHNYGVRIGAQPVAGRTRSECSYWMW